MQRSEPVKAAFLALAASAILSFIDNFVDPVAEEAGLWQFQVFRLLMAAPLLLLMARFLNRSLLPKSWRAVIWRSLAVSTGLLIYFGALGVLTVAQAGAGLFSAPIWILLFSMVFFGQKVSIWTVLAMIAGFLGVLMLLQPDFSRFSAATLAPFAAGAFYGLGMLLTRKLASEESALCLALGVFITMGTASLILLFVTTFIAPGGTGFVFQGWEMPTFRFIWLTFIQALGAVIAVSLIAEAYRVGEPSFVAVFEYSFLIFATIWAFMLTGERTDMLSMLGIAVILVSGAAISAFNRRV